MIRDLEDRQFKQPVFGCNELNARFMSSHTLASQKNTDASFGTLNIRFSHGGADSFFTHLIEIEASLKVGFQWHEIVKNTGVTGTCLLVVGLRLLA